MAIYEAFDDKIINRVGGGGSPTPSGYTINISASSSELYGQTIDVYSGGTKLTELTFSNSGSATLTVQNTGTYTFSVTITTMTYSSSVTVTEAISTYNTTIRYYPNGSTVTPTDDISIWLACGQRTENYTTLAEVLADSTCLSALMADSNAVDYLVRSTTWISGVCAYSSAMTYIGLNNYASNTLLADSDWCAGICNSAYFESVLNVKVPTMTSNTAPSGVASANSVHSDCYAYKAFDSASNGWLANGNATMGSAYVQYMFPYDVNVKKFSAKFNVSNGYTATVKVQGSNDGNNFTNLSSNLTYANSFTNFNLSNFAFYNYYRILYISNNVGNKGNDGNGHKYQFYGRRNI